MEVCADLHLLGEDVENVFLEERVANSLELVQFKLRSEMVEDRVCGRRVFTVFAERGDGGPVGKLRSEMVEDRVCGRRVFTVFAERGDGGPVGACTDEDLVDVLCIDFSVVGEIQRNFLVKSVDEEVKELVLVDFTVCLLGIRHTFCKQTSQLTGFVMY
ncbi:hypothetical protein C498_10371 [Haloferax volcanii DS2]|uniref:Uncharacterized protein n=1 Tax=Haloferax volcanii (strain ATCC 29605 / DSM 3757 / JCM 8879 / NBRC 14742 / NCIMB 2012 / VKM B-1768 / DS2) TaxID=309800 RepID=L9V4C0_HALVD|nr:hypothetical protein C498_10371 [Haloferax volcanii DS2]